MEPADSFLTMADLICVATVSFVYPAFELILNQSFSLQFHANHYELYAQPAVACMVCEVCHKDQVASFAPKIVQHNSGHDQHLPGSV